MKIDLDPLVEQSFEIVKIKHDCDLEEQLRSLPSGVFRARLTELINYMGQIFESYESLINDYEPADDQSLTFLKLKMLKEALFGDGLNGVGIKSAIGGFLLRKEITGNKINSIAISEFLITIANLIASHIKLSNQLDLRGISDEDRHYFNLEFIKQEMLLFPQAKLDR